ncbi:hypothetical protein LUZ60_016029 [Juncus effusus]|nr:hypothetical protein LUZ60_016029 [Juncus effusus]
MNGSYYGPPIPPRSSYRSVGRSRSCCCCCLFECCFNCLFKIIFSILVTVALIILVIWLVLRPERIKAHVDSGSLTKFDLSNNTLLYDLTLNVSIRNPNKKIGIYYDYIEAQAYYDGSTRFGFETLPSFFQHKKSTNYINPVFNGTQLMVESSAGSTYKKENGEGYYYVDLKIRTRIRLKIWAFKINHMKPKIDCTLKLPVPGKSNLGTFEGADCKVRYW